MAGFAPRREPERLSAGEFCRAEIDIRRNSHPPPAFSPPALQSPRGSHPRAQTFYKYALACRREKGRVFFSLSPPPPSPLEFKISLRQPPSQVFSESNTQRASERASSHCHARQFATSAEVTERNLHEFSCHRHERLCYLLALSSSA